MVRTGGILSDASLMFLAFPEGGYIFSVLRRFKQALVIRTPASSVA